MYEKWLKAFHVVATTGGFTRAARTLNVGQPTVSAHIKTLEDYFRVELFYRRGRAIELTATGNRLFEITQGLYGHEAEAVSFLRTVGRNERGQLRLGAVGPYDVMAIAHAFRGRHPNVELNIDISQRQALMSRLRAFEIDVALIADRVADPEFVCLPYDSHAVRVMVHRRHRLARRRRIAIADLAGEETILREATSGTRQAFELALRRAGVTVRPVMQINSREAVREAVARGMGLSVVSEREYAPHPDIRLLEVDDPELRIAAFVLCLTVRRTRPLVDAFLRIANEIRPAR